MRDVVRACFLVSSTVALFCLSIILRSTPLTRRERASFEDEEALDMFGIGRDYRYRHTWWKVLRYSLLVSAIFGAIYFVM